MFTKHFPWFTTNSENEDQSPTKNNNKSYSTVTVKSVRNVFSTQLSNGLIDNSLLHPKDIAKVQSSDKFIQRYIDQFLVKKSGDITDQDVIMEILKMLKWRKEYGVNDFVAKDFAIEVLESGLFREAILPNGDMLFCIIGRKYWRMEEWKEIFIKAIIWYYEQLESKLGEDTKIAILFDAQKCGMQQADFSLLTLLPIFLNYYSTTIHKAYWYQIPWFLTAPFYIALKFVPSYIQGRNMVVNDGNIFDTLGGTENVPDFLGGSLETYIPRVPGILSNVEDVGKANGIGKQSIEKFKKSIEMMKTVY